MFILIPSIATRRQEADKLYMLVFSQTSCQRTRLCLQVSSTQHYAVTLSLFTSLQIQSSIDVFIEHFHVKVTKTFNKANVPSSQTRETSWAIMHRPVRHLESSISIHRQPRRLPSAVSVSDTRRVRTSCRYLSARHYQISLESGSAFVQTKGEIRLTLSGNLTAQSVLFDS